MLINKRQKWPIIVSSTDRDSAYSRPTCRPGLYGSPSLRRSEIRRPIYWPFARWL